MEPVHYLGLSTGRSGSGLCPTRNRPDHFGFSIFRPAADRERSRFGWSDFRRVQIGPRSVSGCVNICRILPKVAGYGETWSDLDEISADLEEIKPISARYGRISMSSRPISKRSGLISTRSRLSLRSRTENGRFSFEFRPDLNWSDRKGAISGQIRSGRLNIGFSASNPPTDPPFSGSGSRDPPPIRHRRRVGRLSGRIGRLGRVGRFPDLDG